MKGKAKEDFEKWYYLQNHQDEELNEDVYCFYLLPDSMQWGVIVDWFDSVGLDISNRSHFGEFQWKVKRINYKKRKVEQHTYNAPTRQEARAKAIETATEIYNSK